MNNPNSVRSHESPVYRLRKNFYMVVPLIYQIPASKSVFAVVLQWPSGLFLLNFQRENALAIRVVFAIDLQLFKPVYAIFFEGRSIGRDSRGSPVVTNIPSRLSLAKDIPWSDRQSGRAMPLAPSIN